MPDRYPLQCGCGDKIMVTDSTKREDFREHWRSDCPVPPTGKARRETA